MAFSAPRFKVLECISFHAFMTSYHVRLSQKPVPDCIGRKLQCNQVTRATKLATERGMFSLNLRKNKVLYLPELEKQG